MPTQTINGTLIFFEVEGHGALSCSCTAPWAEHTAWDVAAPALARSFQVVR
ncbi:hypothetical protein [Sinomonas terrae]|uniref:Uncharacterized protein n=1 Tax=Sinomonas terrae TaxID=2908838 RepID=A0ABS9U3C8_9MICC|nr:hypothetical protein [Sinomonas terrae]MCH6471194.1 hypothetical protein [Sinomonas terrae]